MPNFLKFILNYLLSLYFSYLCSIKIIPGIIPAGKTQLERLIYLHIAKFLEKFRILHMQFAKLQYKIAEKLMEHNKMKYIYLIISVTYI